MAIGTGGTGAPAEAGAEGSAGAAPAEGAGRPGRHIRFAVVSVALLMGSIDSTSVATALKQIGEGLDSPLSWTGWTITVYQLGVVIAMPTAGRFSDVWGRKRTFMCCLALFTTASALCAVAPNIQTLVLCRFLQALGGGGFLPVATGIVADEYGENRHKAIGFFTTIFPIGSVSGPIVGGLVVNYISWRAIFLVNIPIGIVALLVARRLLRESPRTRGQVVDVPSVPLFAGATLAIMYGLGNLKALDGAGSLVPILGPIAGAFVLLSVFWRRQSRVERPLFPVMLLKDRLFVLMNGLNFVYGSAAIGMAALVPLYASLQYDISSLSAGSLLVARSIGILVASFATSMLLERIGYRIPMAVGFLLMGVGSITMSLEPAVVGPYGWLGFTAAIAGIGLGIQSPPANNAILDRVPGAISSITGLRSMFRQFGAIIAVSTATALTTAAVDQGARLGQVFRVFGVMLILVVPLVRFVPDRDRVRGPRAQARLEARAAR